MEKLKINPNNNKYYSGAFIKGFECGVERQFNADLVENTMKQIEELEKIKAEIYNKCPCTSVRETTLYILDKHISELKGENK